MNSKLFFIFLLVVTACGGKTGAISVFVADGYAIGGYDAVAYFKESQPVRGSEDLSYVWSDATWLFSSEANLEAFKTDPEKYAPQYGGFCAYGCYEGHKAPTEPEAWTIIDGKLYLNYNIEVRDLWRENDTKFIKEADKNWPQLMNEQNHEE
jgi:hypothetical protein